MSPASSSSKSTTASVLDLGGLAGLGEAEARQRLEREGPNELPTQKQRGLWAIALEVVREPMFLMLVAAGSLYVFTGEPADAALLLGSVVIVMAITIVQERRTERALDALRDLSSPRALVIRDGARRRIAGREVVRGDLVVLAEGDRVPADALLRRAINLSADESLLTGESVPVRKTPSATATRLDAPGGDDLPSVFSGSLVTAGQGIAEVLAIGAHSELGRIGKALGKVQPEPTLLQKETGRLVRLLALAGVDLDRQALERHLEREHLLPFAAPDDETGGRFGLTASAKRAATVSDGSPHRATRRAHHANRGRRTWFSRCTWRSTSVSSRSSSRNSVR